MNAVLHALAEPNRLHIVELLRDKPHSVNEIVAQLRLKQPLVSKHLRALNEAGLVSVQPRAHQRIYALRAEPLQDLSAWLGTFEHHWNKRFNTLDDYIEKLNEAGHGSRQ